MSRTNPTAPLSLLLPDVSLGPVTLLNAPVLTAQGIFRFSTISAPEARSLVRERGFFSAIGHTESAVLLSLVLDIECPVNRIDYRQLSGELALVLRLARRLPEGKILRSVEEIEAAGYSLALLARLPENRESGIVQAELSYSGRISYDAADAASTLQGASRT